MKRVSSCLILSFLILFIASQLSYAEPNGPINKMEKEFHDECPPPMIQPMPYLQSINLDEKQKEALRDIESSFTKELIRKRADEQIAEIELRDLLKNDTVDLSTVEKKLKQIATIKIETQVIFIKAIEKMKTKLTPEQREILKKMRSMDPRMGPPMKREMMHDETKMPPPSTEKRN